MASEQLTAGQAREIGKPILQLARALEESVRVLDAAKLAGGKLAQAEAARATALTEVETAKHERDGIAAEAVAERERQFDAITAEATAERIRLARALESERLALTKLEQEHQVLEGAIAGARKGLIEAREEAAAGIAAARREEASVRQTLEGDQARLRASVAEITGRLEAKRKEYRELLEQVKSVLRA